MSRRWTSGTEVTFSGMAFRVAEGSKEDGDLRIEWGTPGGWRPIEMGVAALLTDFFIENEDVLKQYRPHWRRTAAEFWFEFLSHANREGWEAAVTTYIREPRSRAVAAPVSGTFAQWCGERHPEEPVRCTRPEGHDGPHKQGDDDYIWPRRAA